MSRKKPRWMGSSVDSYIAGKMKDPAFRLAIAEARAKRIKRALAEAIQAARQRSKLSQAALAKRAKTTQAVISRIENPTVPYLPSVVVLTRIAQALGAYLEIAFIPKQETAAQKTPVTSIPRIIIRC